MKPYFEKLFRLKENNTTIGTEVIAGLVTFATMSYITCVQPAILSGRFFGISTNMPFDALLTTTCLTAALRCFLMGLYANYPIALAAGMGENILMVITLIPACSVLVGSEAGPDAAWQLALGVVFIAGLVLLILSFLNIRKLLIGAVSNSMKNAIAVGIGLFIALLGLENGKMIIGASGHYILNPLHSTETFIFLVGLTVIAVLQVRRIRGAILLGMLFSTLVALLLGVIRPTALLGWPANPLPVIGQADIAGVFSHFADLLPLLIIFIYMDVFDTLGTVIGVGARAGLLKNGHLPRVERVFSVDALSTVVGAAAGMSTVTCFVESSAGVESGGRTGLTAVVCGLAFLLVLFFTPLLQTIIGYTPITAPALVIVGAMMVQNVTLIDWQDYSEAIPSFLIIIGIPFSYSIADGMLLGVISYPVIKLLAGRGRNVGWLSYLLAALLAAYLFFLKR